MKQLIKNNRTGLLSVEEVPSPKAQPGHIIVQNLFSAVSVGTEKAQLEIAKKNLLQKAKSRPVELKKVMKLIKSEGILSAYRKSMNMLNLPASLGYSSVGKVLEIAEDVKKYSIGDLVACGGCGHAEIISVPKNLCALVPEGVNLEHAAFTTIASISMQGVRQADVSVGENVAVIGLGLIGQITLQILSASGCNPIGIDTDHESVSKCKEMGFSCLYRDNLDIESDLLSLTNGFGADSVIITAATSSNDPIEFASHIIRDRGKISVVGAVKTDLPRAPFYSKELSLNFSRSYGPGRYDNNYEIKGYDYPIGFVRWTEQRNMSSVLNLMKQAKLDLSLLSYSVIDFLESASTYNESTDDKNSISRVFKYSNSPTRSTRIVFKRKNERKSLGKVKIGFIGAGSYAQNTLLPIISRIKDVDLLGVCTSKGRNSNYVAKKFNFHYSTANYLAILNDDDINCVFILTRHDLHSEYVVKCLKQDKHVFVEKPLALNKKELKSIKNSLIESKGSLMVGFNRRFSECGKKSKDFFEGRNYPLAINYRINIGLTDPNHWSHDIEIGGGRIIGEMCHFVDFCNFLCQSEIIEFDFLKLNDSNQTLNYSNTVTLIMKYADGSIANVSYISNGDSSFPKERVEIFGGGSVACIDNYKELTLVRSGKSQKINLRGQDKGQREMIKAYINSLSTDKDIINLDDLFSVTDLMFKI